MIQGFYHAPLGLVGLYLIILCPFYAPSGKHINKSAGQWSCCYAYFTKCCLFVLYLHTSNMIKWPYSVIDATYKMPQNKIQCQKPLTFQWSEALLWSMFLMWTSMLSWLTALRHHSDNQKEDEVTGTSTCVHACPGMNNTVPACLSVSSTHTCAQIFFHEQLASVHCKERPETGNCTKSSYNSDGWVVEFRQQSRGQKRAHVCCAA